MICYRTYHRLTVAEIERSCMMNNSELIEAAKKAREFSYAPLSGFKVGAALLTDCGKVFTGCNIEDPSGIGITNICAERCAIVKAVSEGYKSFAKIAVAGGKDETILCLPCGACRQFLNSFNPYIIIIAQDKNDVKEYKLDELLPHSFSETF